MTAIFMSASTAASKSSASAMPASAWRTTPTPSGRAGIVRRTSGGGLRHSPAPFARRLDRLFAPAHDREHGDEARDVEDPLDPGLDGLADADDIALAGVQRAAARVEQRAEHRGVHERGAGEVDTMPPPRSSASSRRSRSVGAV